MDQHCLSKTFVQTRMRPIFILYAAVLILIVALFAEIQGLHKPYVVSSIYKREVFFLELMFVILVMLDRKVVFPDITKLYRPTVLLCGLWLSWSFFSALSGVNQPLALYTFAEHIVLVLFSISVYSVIQSFKQIDEKIIWLILAGFFVYCVFLFWTHFLGGDVRRESFAVSLIEVGFRNIRHLGYYLAIVLVVATGVGAGLSIYTGRLSLWISGIVASLAWGLIFWLGGRGPIVSFFVTLPFVVYLFYDVTQIRKILLFVSVTCLFGALLSWFMPYGYGLDYILSRFLGSTEVLTSEGIDVTQSGRLKIWAACSNDVIQNPLFGLGQNGYRSGCGSDFPGSSQPHGFHIQALLDWGVPGALFFALFVVVLLRRAFRESKTSLSAMQRLMIPYWGVLMLLVFSLFDGVLFQRFSLMFFALFLAMTMPVSVNKDQESFTQNDNRVFYLSMLFAVVSIMLFLRLTGYPLTVEYIKI